MKPKSMKTLYWIFTILFCLLCFMDGIGGITKQQAGQDVLKHLGYPMYLLTITGIAKLFAAVAILQTKYKTIKEWAFAGMTFNFIGAFLSRIFLGDPIGECLPPLIMLAFMFVPYILWKKNGQEIHTIYTA